MVLLDAILEKAYRLVHWPPGPRQGWATGFDSSPRADNTSVRAGGVLSVGIPRFSTNLNILRSICSGHGDPARRAAAHTYSGQRSVKTKRARARSCASVVTRKRPSLNRARMVDNDSTLPETTWQVITYRPRGLSQF